MLASEVLLKLTLSLQLISLMHSVVGHRISCTSIDSIQELRLTVPKDPSSLWLWSHHYNLWKLLFAVLRRGRNYLQYSIFLGLWNSLWLISVSFHPFPDSIYSCSLVKSLESLDLKAGRAKCWHLILASYLLTDLSEHRVVVCALHGRLLGKGLLS